MDSLDRTLDAIAHMMDPSREHSREEIMVWKALIRHVDRDTFEKTGRIVAAVPAPTDLVGTTVPRMSLGAVESAIERLAARGLLETNSGKQSGNPSSKPLRFQLFLAPSADRVSTA